MDGWMDGILRLLTITPCPSVQTADPPNRRQRCPNQRNQSYHSQQPTVSTPQLDHTSPCFDLHDRFQWEKHTVAFRVYA